MKKGTLRGIGDDLAEKLEREMNKQEGWMDTPHGDESHIGLDIRSLYQAISWV
ncbi:MAG: hypothetical protein AB2689_05435 [Candidatus Thiodiazotropha taylori]